MGQISREICLEERKDKTKIWYYGEHQMNLGDANNDVGSSLQLDEETKIHSLNKTQRTKECGIWWISNRELKAYLDKKWTIKIYSEYKENFPFSSLYLDSFWLQTENN